MCPENFRTTKYPEGTFREKTCTMSRPISILSISSKENYVIVIRHFTVEDKDKKNITVCSRVISEIIITRTVRRKQAILFVA